MSDKKKENRKFDKNFVFRCFICFIGLWVMAFGVAFSIKAGIGTTPISSLPYVGSLVTPLTVGKCSIIMHAGFILIQILILRKDYDLFQLIQIPLSLTFGYLTDFAVWALSWVQPANYLQNWIFTIVGIVVVGIGVNIQVKSKITTLPGEGISLAICQKTSKIKFSTMKIIFDTSLVVSACILSLLTMHKIIGVREGTVAAALCVGFVIKGMNKILSKISGKQPEAGRS